MDDLITLFQNDEFQTEVAIAFCLPKEMLFPKELKEINAFILRKYLEGDELK